MTPVDFERELGAADGNAFAVEPTLHQSAALRQPNRDRAVRGLYHVGGGTHPGAGIPGVLLGAEVTAGLSRRDMRGATQGAVAAARDADLLAEARETTRRVARTFALACRLLPRDVRDDVYLLYLVFRTLDDLVDERRARRGGARSPRSRRGRGRRGRATREVACSRDLAPAPPAAARRAAPTSARGCATTSTARRSRTEADLDRYCYRVAGTVGVVMARVLGTTDPSARCRPRPRSAWRCSARTSCATSTRTSRAAASTSPRATLARCGGSLAPGRARGAPARPDRPRRRALRGGAAPASRCCAAAAAAIARRGGDVPRDPAPDRARRLRRAGGPRGRRRGARKLVVAARCGR